MAGCVLRVSGKAFAADAFLAGSSLVACKVWHEGEPGPLRRPASATSGFNVLVSDSDDLPEQVLEAIAFLRHHRADLARLATATAVDGVMDFGVPQREVAAQFDRFP